ncbi:MAG TPA: hypothetical protein VHG89_08735 [Verrucomicrobiae bacterium]|nr:hypothetical protein [Verrucomicrobiae bacterium]
MIGIVFLFLLFQSSCSTQSYLNHYSGDGEPKIIPNPFFVSDGYTVQFKPVSLNKPVKMTYHFKGLPKVAWQVEVYFVIEGSQDWRWRNEGNRASATNTVFIDDLKGTLEMSLKDINGNIIFQVTNMLSKLTWEQGGKQSPALYDSKTFFTASSIKEYVLDVSIVPDSTLKNNEGYVLFRSGGWEPISIGF